MKSRKHSSLSLAVSAIAFTALCGSNVALAQVTNELDLTISVMTEGETPEGFINRLDLPALDALVNADVAADIAAQAQAEIVADAVAETTSVADDASQVVTDTVREVISVDGTVAGAVGGVAGGGNGGGNGVVDVIDALPPAIVDILDNDLPLEDTLTDSLDGLDGVVDTLPDVLPDTNLPGSLSDIGGVLNNAAIDSSLSTTVNEIVGDVSDDPLENLQDLPVGDSPLSDVLAPVTDDIPELPDIPGL